jgi:hypothetical protein
LLKWEEVEEEEEPRTSLWEAEVLVDFLVIFSNKWVDSNLANSLGRVKMEDQKAIRINNTFTNSVKNYKL